MEQTIEKGSRKARRMTVSADKIISDSMYNITIGAVILYGLIVNLCICTFLPAERLLAGMTSSQDLWGLNMFCLALSIGGCIISGKSRKPLISFLGYNLVVFSFSIIVDMDVALAGGIGSMIVTKAFLYTSVITLVMVSASSIFPEFFSKLGGVLFAALIGLILVSVISILIPGEASPFAMQAEAFIGAIVFSLYIGYDIYKAQTYPKTIDNAVDSALDIYMDIVLLFLKLLSLFGSDD